MTCSQSGKTYSLNQLVPELAMSDLSKWDLIDQVTLQRNEVIGQGAFGTVWKGEPICKYHRILTELSVYVPYRKF